MKLTTVFVVLFAASASASGAHRLTKRQVVNTASCSQEEIAAILPAECADELAVIQRSETEFINNDTAALAALCDFGCLDSIVEVTRECTDDDFVYFDFIDENLFCARNERGERCAMVYSEFLIEALHLITVNCFDEVGTPPFCRESCNQTTFSDLIANLGCCINRLRTIPILNATGHEVPYFTPLIQCGVDFPGPCSTAAVLRFSVLSFLVVLVAAVIF